MNLLYNIILLFLLSSGRVLAQLNTACVTPNNARGRCISIKKCAPLLNLLQRQRPLPQSIINYLRESNCGFEGSIPQVCCPATSNTQTTPQSVNTQPPVETQIQDVSYHPKINLLPEYCGELNNDNKITNGEDSVLFEFPWMALLGYAGNDGYLRYLCGGTVINQRYILTAAHCIKDSPYPLVQVRLGEHDLRTERDCQEICAPPVQDIAVERVKPHPQYRKSERNDIGLVRLARDIIFNEAVRPVCLPVGREEQMKTLNGEKVTVTGWGTTENGTSSSVLLKVDVPVIPVPRCAQIYINDAKITNQFICAGGSKGKDSCKGDSGGPLQSLVQKSGDLVYIQYGIVSFGPRNCGTEGYPGVYTRVGYFMKWILDTIRP